MKNASVRSVSSNGDDTENTASKDDVSDYKRATAIKIAAVHVF
jgi:hypothetical protein